MAAPIMAKLHLPGNIRHAGDSDADGEPGSLQTRAFCLLTGGPTGCHGLYLAVGACAATGQDRESLDGIPGSRRNGHKICGGAGVDEQVRADVDRSAACLLAGGVVLLPTDTVYGLAVHPEHDDAITRLFAMKGRPDVRSTCP